MNFNYFKYAFKNKITYKIKSYIDILVIVNIRLLFYIFRSYAYQVMLSQLKNDGAQVIKILPAKESPLFIKSEEKKSIPLYFRVDDGVAHVFLSDSSYTYSPEIHRFLGEVITNNTTKNIVLDVGSNIGLISRQLYCNYEGFIDKFFCYEPDIDNYNVLKKILLTNLIAFI